MVSYPETWDLFRVNHCTTTKYIFQPSTDPSQSMALVDLPRGEPQRSRAIGSSVAQSRRAKNAAHRADDVGVLQLLLGWISIYRVLGRVCLRDR